MPVNLRLGYRCEMRDGHMLSYGDALAISWSINWRLGIANLIILLVLAGVSSLLPSSVTKGLIFALALFVLDLCVAWPVILNKALSVHTGAVQLNIYGNRADEGLRISYGKSLLLALVVEVATIIFAVLTTVVLLLAGVHMERGTNGNGINLLMAALRLFVVVPLGIKFFSQRSPTTYQQDSSFEMPRPAEP